MKLAQSTYHFESDYELEEGVNETISIKINADNGHLEYKPIWIDEAKC